MEQINSPLIDTLTSLEDIIYSLSDRSDFEEMEEEYLNSIPRLIPAHATAVYLFKPEKKEPMRIGARGIDMDFITHYEKKGREMDPLRGNVIKLAALKHNFFLSFVKT